MTLAYYGKSRQRQALLAIATFFAIAIGLIVAGVAIKNAAAVDASTRGIAPVLSTGGPSSESEVLAACAPYDNAYSTGTNPGVGPTTVAMGGGASVVVTEDANQKYAAFVSNVPILRVFIKGGSDSNSYTYPPTYPSGVLSDGNLHAPINPANNTPYGVSHIVFCWNDPEPNPTFSKSAGDGDSQTTGAQNYIGQDAFFNISIASTASVAQTVKITDANTTFMWQVSTGGTGSCSATPGVTTSPYTCTVNAGQTLTILVKKTAAALSRCLPTDVTNSAAVALLSGPSDTSAGTALGSTNSVTVTIPQTGSQSDCEQVLDPTVTKTKNADGVTGGFAYWNVNVDNTANSQTYGVQIIDAGATYVSVTGGSCTATANVTSMSSPGISCTANASATMVVKVKKAFGPSATCEEQTINNTAIVKKATGETLATVGGGSDTLYTIAADLSLCGVPTISKSAGNFNTANDTATWTITINNTGANSISREIVVTDAGTTLTAVSGGSCTNSLPSASPFNCTVAGGGTLVLTVTKSVPQTCGPQEVTNTASASIAGEGGAALGNSPVTSATLQIPADTNLCGVPTISKSAGNFNTANDTATWTITISNTGANSISRNIVVTDAGTTLTTVAPAGACGSLPDADGSFSCTVAAGGTLTLTVTRVIGQACQPGSVTNSATAAIDGGATLGGSPATAPALEIPADTNLCGVPTVTKTAGSFNATTDIASWNITINNTGANSIARTVVVTDAGATLVAISGGTCATSLPLPDATGPFTCDVAAGGTLVLTVTRGIAQICDNQTVTNTASVTIAGQNIGGSPVTSAALTIPGDGSLCPVLIFEFPTPTPVPPTPTPVPPTATPVPPTPTPIDAALGERTPGALSTPIAPSTGSGTAGSTSSFNGLFALVGLIVLGSGLAVVAVGRKAR